MIVNDPSIIRRIIQVLESPNAITILRCGLAKTVSAPELMKELQIPSASLYRCVEDLLDAKLMVKVRSGRTVDGHWFDEYRTVVKEIRFCLSNGGVTMELVSTEDMVNRFLRLWGEIGRR